VSNADIISHFFRPSNPLDRLLLICCPFWVVPFSVIFPRWNWAMAGIMALPCDYAVVLYFAVTLSAVYWKQYIYLYGSLLV